MPGRHPQTTVLMALGLVLCVFLIACGDADALLDEGTSVLEYRHQDLLYTFHLPTGTEALFDLNRDPACLDNVLPHRREEAAQVRQRLEKSLHVRNLEDLRDKDSPVLRSLKALGYI